jgi:hypothetical protein
VQIFPVLSQVDDRVADQLSRSVKGDVSPPLDLEDLDTAAQQLCGG